MTARRAVSSMDIAKILLVPPTSAVTLKVRLAVSLTFVLPEPFEIAIGEPQACHSPAADRVYSVAVPL